MKQLLSALILFLLIISGCKNYDRSGDSMTSGRINAGIDESYSLMISSQIDVFQNDYPDAEVTALYKPESEIIDDLLRDSIQAAVISRALTEEEMVYFRSRQKVPEVSRIATDGIALIVHPQNKDTVFTIEQIQSAFSGQLRTWGQVRGEADARNIRIVFDHSGSSNARYIRERFLNGSDFPDYCFAVHSNSEVIDYVNQNPDAIGVISVSWISDREDSTSQAFLKKIKVIGIVDASNTDKPEMARKPYQAYIYDKTYPLRQDVYAIRTSSKSSVGTGFVSFLRGDKGQLVIHKMGMVAAESPSRVIVAW